MFFLNNIILTISEYYFKGRYVGDTFSVAESKHVLLGKFA